MLKKSSLFRTALTLFLSITLFSYLAWGVPDKGNKDSSANLFPNSFQTTGIGEYLSVKNSSALDPVSGEDFLLTAWVRLKNLPKENERVIFVSKYVEKSRHKEGYALGLERDGIGIRPVVYWKGVKSKGGWYTFQELKFSPRDWIFLGLSFTGNKYLGLHSAVISDEETRELSLLGGYQVAGANLPASEEPLQYGIFRNVDIKGRLGPLGVFSDNKLSKELDDIFNSIVSNREKLPDLKGEMKLWLAKDLKDLSRSSHAIKRVKQNFPVTGKRNKKKS